jgi:hypothetical protein
MKHRRRGLGFTLVALCTAMGLVLAGGPATAADPTKPEAEDTSLPREEVPGGFQSWKDLLVVQERLYAAAERFTTATAGEEGFAGVEASPENRRLVVFWQGQLSTAAARQLEEIKREVPVEVVAARHSLRTLSAAQDAIAQERGVTEVAAHEDGSGLTVGFAGSEEEARQLPSIREAKVPVTIEAGSSIEETGCSGRQDDCSPYWGGARYVNPGGGKCSSGFSLKFTSVYGSTYYRMLSAGHCASNGNLIKDGGGETMGTVTGDTDSKDILLIYPYPVSVGYAGRVYTGPWNSGLASNKRVGGATLSFKGGWVCTSGASTGIHCNVKILQTNVTIWGTVKTVKATAPAGMVAAGKGDSGGPVFAHRVDGRVNAKGTISAGQYQVTCPAGSPSSKCYRVVYYVGIFTSLAHYSGPFVSASVVTS